MSLYLPTMPSTLPAFLNLELCSLKMKPTKNKRERGKFILLASVVTEWVAKKSLNPFRISNLTQVRLLRII